MIMRSSLMAGALFCFCVLPAQVSAKSFGVEGQTFPIAEEHLIDMIERKLREAEKNGEIADLQDRMTQSAKRSVERPVPVEGISPALVYQTFEYDPTVTAAQDYLDLDGNVVVKAGKTVNPFDMVSLNYDLLFIDGDRKAEVEWALKAHAEKAGAVRIILLKGAPLEIMREHKVRVYFDQKAALSRQFQLAKTPSRITQKDRILLIEEIPVGLSDGEDN